jgi:hypothetical protein
MDLAEASARAAALGLTALVDRGGWCLLCRLGVRLEGRGGTWEEAFANYEAAQCVPPPGAVPVLAQRDLWDMRTET